jgi:hypothetical protein
MTDAVGVRTGHTIEVLTFLLATSPILAGAIQEEVTEAALRAYTYYEQRTEEEQQAYIDAIQKLRRLAIFIIARTEEASQEL